MSYIGSSATPLPVNFSAVQSQGFNGTGSQTTFTLNRSVGSAASVEVLVNNVQQSPYDGSYNITGGTSLVFSEAPSAGTNNVYVVYRDQALGSLTDTGAVRKTGDTMTGRLTISAGADRSIDLLNSSGVTQGYIGVEGAFGGVPSNALRLRGEGGVVLGANGTAHLTCDSSGRVTMPYQPALYVNSTGYSSKSGVQNFPAALDRGGNYNSTNGRFTCPVAGAYVVNFTALHDVNSSTIRVFKNGAAVSHAGWMGAGEFQTATCCIVACVVGDYLTCESSAQVEATYTGYSIHLLG